MKTWSGYYQDRVGESYARYCTCRYKPFLDAIRNMHAVSPVEEGCGIGTMSKILGVTRSFDLDRGMIDLSCRNLIPAVQKSITIPVECDLFFSHGVLEHLSDDIIHQVINRGGRQVHYVPSNHYSAPSFGDERLMSAMEWKSKFNPDTVIEFNNGKDLVLIWQK